MKRFMNGVVFVVIVAGQLYAQPTSAPPASANPVPAGKQLSEIEMTQRGVDLQTQTREDLEHVQQLQALARKDKDVIKYACVNDKLIKLKAEANIFDIAHADLTASLSTDARFTTYSAVTSAADRVHKVREEADGCAGEPELNSGDTGNSFNPPEIVDDPTKANPLGDSSSIEPPSYASPYT